MTGSDHTSDKPNENPKHEHHNWMHKHRKSIAEGIVLSLYFWWDAHAIWPDSHSQALLAGVVGISAVLLIELSWTRWIVATSALGIIAIIFYLIVGPTPPPAPWRGWLQPASEPSPPNACDKMPLGDDAITVIVGSSAYKVNTNFLNQARDKRIPLVPLAISSCPALSVNIGPNGARVNSTMYGADGSLLGQITDNGYDIPKSDALVVEHTGDLSTLIVHNLAGEELLYVRYLNPHTIRLRGKFSCPAKPGVSVTVTNDAILPFTGLRGICTRQSVYGVVIN